MEKYNEILRLKEMLTQHKIPFDFSEFQGGYHICYPNKDNVICSVIEHDGSYGREKDKLEIQGLLTEQELEETEDTVLGYLTAEDVFERISRNFTQSDILQISKVLITGISCSSEYSCCTLSDGTRKRYFISSTLIFYSSSFGSFNYSSINEKEINELMNEIKNGIENGRTFTITYNTSSRTVLKIFAETNSVTSQCLKETEKEDKDLIQQLAKCSDKIKELEQKIAKKKKKISKLKSKNSNFKDIINKFVLETKYLKDKCEALEASCIEAKLDMEGISKSEHDLIVKCSDLEKCMKVIKETLNKPDINNETKLSEIKKIIDF